MANLPDKDARIGIIGGGPAGLSSAYFLQKKGYKNLTVLEKEKSVGGKALTVDMENSDGIVKNYELGAEFITYVYDIIWDFCDILNEETQEASPIRIINKTGDSPRFLDPLKIQPLTQIVPASIKYLYFGFKNSKLINSPSNVNVSSNKLLSMKTSEFIDKYSLQSLAGLFLIEQFGYGNLDTFPVVHLYRTVKPKLMLRILGDQIPIIKNLFKRPIAGIAMDGTQGLFKKLAAYVNEQSEKQVVYVNQNVTHVSRSKNDDGKEIVTVTVDENVKHEFDVLIVAIPPNFLLQLMGEDNLSKNEVELFSKFSFHPYYVGSFETVHEQKLPIPRFYYSNIYPDMDGDKAEPEPVQFTKRWDDTNITARGYNWQQADIFVDDDKQKLDHLEEVFNVFMTDRMGAPNYKLMSENKYWGTYHPHVPIEDFQNGFYDKFELLQGENNFFYVGSAIAFESMEQTVEYSKLLVQTYF